MIAVLFLVAAALLPPLILLRVVYRMDTVESEPGELLRSLFLRGVLAMVPIFFLELACDQFVDFFPFGSLAYLFLSYFVVPGFVEEGVKYRVLYGRTWNDGNFDYRFDAVVYAVFVSLGFAAVENIMYVMTTGFGTAVMRALFSIPGHAMFGVVMGVGYGAAKALEAQGEPHRAALRRRRAWIAAAILHGFYDFLLVGFGWVFYLYFLGMLILVVRLLKRCSGEDEPVNS